MLADKGGQAQRGVGIQIPPVLEIAKSFSIWIITRYYKDNLCGDSRFLYRVPFFRNGDLRVSKLHS